MRAVVMRNKELVVDTVPDPEPGPGEAIVKTLACGICGSDLHALKFADNMVDDRARDATRRSTWTRRATSSWATSSASRCSTTGRAPTATSSRAARGLDAARLPADAASTASATRTTVPGGYGELMVLNASLLLEVPNGLGTEHAAHDRADGRRPARRREGAARSRRRGDGVRLRPGRARRHRGAEAQGRRADRRRRLLADAPRARDEDGRARRRRSEGALR